MHWCKCWLFEELWTGWQIYINFMSILFDISLQNTVLFNQSLNKSDIWMFHQMQRFTLNFCWEKNSKQLKKYKYNNEIERKTYYFKLDTKMCDIFSWREFCYKSKISRTIWHISTFKSIFDSFTLFDARLLTQLFA